MVKKTTFYIITALIFNMTTRSQTPGIHFEYIDSSYKAQDDFNKFCNGKWLKTATIPSNETSWGSFNQLNERNLKNIYGILKEVSKNKTAKSGSNEQKLRDFFNTAMDSVKANKLGITPILPLLKEIDNISDNKSLFIAMARLLKAGVTIQFAIDVDVDLKDSKRYAFYLMQSGFKLPTKDYYFSPNFSKIDSAYVQYISAQMHHVKVIKQQHLIFDMEKQMASQAMNATELRDIEKQYNPMSYKDLKTKYNNFLWDDFFAELNFKVPDTVIVGQPLFFENLNTLLTKYSINEWKTYLKWSVMNDAANYLTDKISIEAFNFWGKTLQGAKKRKPRWKYAQQEVNNNIGEILSQLYVEKYFDQNAKKKINELVDNLMVAYRERIKTRTWMSEETKKKANEKLDKIIRKLGYPDKWKDYSSLTIGTTNYFDNIAASEKFRLYEKLNKLNKPVDRYEWLMTPITVNAYYNPTTNEITFPAAIMQPPFFDPNADDAANYGGIGAVIGHELTHGFDDQGAQFDADGNMKMWWTEQDFKNFQVKAEQIVQQFNQYIAIDTLHVNGKLTAGENIADLGGITMSYYAYLNSLKGKPSPIIKGYTGEQRFFIAWAQVWQSLIRDERLKQLITMDPHSPAFIRAFAPLTNLTEFYKAFNVKPSDKMYRADDKRIEIW